MKLDSSHVQYVMDCMKDNTTYVRNIKKYLLAALYNAPSHHQQLLFFPGAARYVRGRAKGARLNAGGSNAGRRDAHC